MPFWHRIVIAASVILIVVLVARAVDWWLARRDLPPGAETRYRVLRRAVTTTIIAVGIFSALLVIPQVRGLAAGLLMLGLSFGGLFSGALITEIMFAWPGMGKMMFQAILDNDYNLALVGLLFTTFTTIVGNLLADLALVAIDPRVTLASRLR